MEYEDPVDCLGQTDLKMMIDEQNLDKPHSRALSYL